MSYIVVDVEGDGPIQGVHSMVCFGAVIIGKDGNLDKTFYSGLLQPIGEEYVPDALAVSGFTREQMEVNGREPSIVMSEFKDWIKENSKGRPILISDNNGYDAPWINWYFHKFIGDNPFGWSSRRIGDMFCGFMNNTFYKWKQHRSTIHDHNPVNDAKGNAEALIWLQKQGFKIKF